MANELETYHMKALVAGAALALMALAGQAQAQMTPDDFTIRTTADLVKLCDTPENDKLHTAAVQFCLGYGSGVYQSWQLHQSGSRARPLFCAPGDPPPRADTMQKFIGWAKASPTVGAIAPAAGVLQYLMETYPCPAGRR